MRLGPVGEILHLNSMNCYWEDLEGREQQIYLVMYGGIVLKWAL
jgi:hypothetical protein